VHIQVQLPQWGAGVVVVGAGVVVVVGGGVGTPVVVVGSMLGVQGILVRWPINEPLPAVTASGQMQPVLPSTEEQVPPICIQNDPLQINSQFPQGSGIAVVGAGVVVGVGVVVGASVVVVVGSGVVVLVVVVVVVLVVVVVVVVVVGDGVVVPPPSPPPPLSPQLQERQHSCSVVKPLSG